MCKACFNLCLVVSTICIMMTIDGGIGVLGFLSSLAFNVSAIFLWDWASGEDLA